MAVTNDDGWTDTILTHRRYASLHVIASANPDDNPLLILEILHRYVETLDAYFGDVCELDIVYGMQAAHAILDELLLAGELQESSRRAVVKHVRAMDEEASAGDIVPLLEAAGVL